MHWGIPTQECVYVHGVLKRNKNTEFVFEKYSWGPETQKKLGSGAWGLPPGAPLGGRAGSENDTLLPLTTTHDWRTFRNNPSWRSKIIVRKP